MPRKRERVDTVSLPRKRRERWGESDGEWASTESIIDIEVDTDAGRSESEPVGNTEDPNEESDYWHIRGDSDSEDGDPDMDDEPDLDGSGSNDVAGREVVLRNTWTMILHKQGTYRKWLCVS